MHRTEQIGERVTCSWILKEDLKSLVLFLCLFFHLKKIRVVDSDGIAPELRGVCKGTRILPTDKCLWLCLTAKRLFGTFFYWSIQACGKGAKLIFKQW